MFAFGENNYIYLEIDRFTGYGRSIIILIAKLMVNNPKTIQGELMSNRTSINYEFNSNIHTFRSLRYDAW